jgi:FKBP-type peptidyl-prolyl cis-trans isomerase (trigger factor)
MPNQIINDYTERKKEEAKSRCVLMIDAGADKWELSMTNDRLQKFLSDMAQEIFGCLPDEATMDKEERALNDLVHTTQRQDDINLGHNFCRSTFLENIKKLK